MAPEPYQTNPYVPNGAPPPQPPKSKGKIVLLCVLAAVLLLGAGAGITFFVLRSHDDAPEPASENAVTVAESTPEPVETPEPTPTPTPESPAEALLSRMNYIGDRSACTMTADQATAFANVIHATKGTVVMAAIFDGGNGVPILWVASADAVKPQNDENTVILTGHYQDKIYGFGRGSLAEYDWMTTLLQAGTDGVMVKTSRDSTLIRFYRLKNGATEPEPFGTARWNHSGDASYNGVSIGAGSEVGLWDFYREAVPDPTILLEAMSGDSENLYLVGPWMPGDEMIELLSQYVLFV